MKDNDIYSICEYILRDIANKDDGDYYDLYPYFKLENGEMLSDNGIDPMRVVKILDKYGLIEPLYEERCELNELGITIGQGIGFIKYKEEVDKKKSKKEIIDKRKEANINHTYFITRPKNIIGIILIVLTFIGLGTYKDIKEYLRSDKENAEAQSQEYKKEEAHISNELEKKKTQEYNNNINEPKNDSTIAKKH
jgi:hypothetical protein